MDIRSYNREAWERPVEFGRSRTDQLAGQMDAGFHLAGMYEGHHSDLKISEFSPAYIATRAVKL